MKRNMTACLLRLYPARWKQRYGEEFAALLEDHPFSIGTILNVLWGALEAMMNSFRSQPNQPAAFGGIIWCAWMAILAAGLNLYATVDDSAFVPAIQSHSLLRVCWRGIEFGALVAGAAIIAAGVPIAWSMIGHAAAARRRDILLRVASPAIGLCLLLAWGVTIVVLTHGRWAPSPWAVAVSQPYWPAASFRWVAGSISVFLLLFALVGSSICIMQALRRSQFPEVRFSLPGVVLHIKPIRFAAMLSPFAAVGAIIMLISVLAWGVLAKQYAGDAFANHFGPLGVTSFTSWLGSIVLFGAGAMACVPAAWRASLLRSAE